MQDDHPGADELEQVFEAYASVRLAPNRRAAARMRIALVEEARMRALDSSIGRSHDRRRGRGRRRVLLLAAAAMLTLATAAAASAGSAPGGPFYAARIWLETALLPVDADSRALERIRQLEERLVDAERATKAGDSSALDAAVDAYQDAVEGAVDEVGTDGERLMRLEEALSHHVSVLEALADKVPEQGARGIDRALEASQKAAEKIGQTAPEETPEP